MNIALIGLGMVAETYAKACASSDHHQITHVFARSDDSRQRFLRKWSQIAAVACECLAEIAVSDVDFVILATPPNGRQEAVAVLSAAGKPILMEKPVERDLARATALVETCEAAGVPLGIVLQHRARPIVQDLRRVLPTLGRLHAVEASVPWWRPQSYYDDPGRGTYDRDGGGVLISQAIHTLDLMLSLTGPVDQVIAIAAKTGFHRMEAEDFVCAGLQFANGAVGQLFASTASFPGRGETITLHCAEGSAHLEAGRLRINRHEGTSEHLGQAASSGAGADPMAFTSDWHLAMIDDFANAIRSARPPLVPGRTALQVHALIDALERSARSGSTHIVDEV